MKLLTKDLRKALPPLYFNENEKDPMVICKFFLPMTKWTWFATEFDGKDSFFGFVVGEYPELGYFTLSKLERITEAYGLQLDETFQPTRLSEVKKVHEPWLYE